MLITTEEAKQLASLLMAGSDINQNDEGMGQCHQCYRESYRDHEEGCILQEWIQRLLLEVRSEKLFAEVSLSQQAASA